MLPEPSLGKPESPSRLYHHFAKIGSSILDPKNLLLYGSTLFLLWLALSPLVMLIWGSFRSAGPGAPSAHFTFDNYIEAFTEPFIYSVMYNTLIYTVGSAAVALVIGIGLAWLVERTNIYLRNLIFVLIVVRIAVPQVMLVMSWILLLSPNIGWINKIIESLTGIAGVFDIYALGGMVWVEGIDKAPLVFLLATAAFRSLDPTFEEAALMSGARLGATLRFITIPLILPALAAAILLVSLSILESFEVPTLLGLRYDLQTFSSAIYFLTNGRVETVPIASTYGIVFFLIAAIGLYFYQRVTAESKKYMTITGKGYRPRRIDMGPWRFWISGVVILFLLFAYVLPIFMLFWASFQPFYNVPSLAALGRASLQNYHFIFDLESTNRALRNSLLLGVSCATLIMFLTGILSWMLVRTRSVLSRLVDLSIFVPISFPGIVLAISVMWVYITLPFGFYGTIWILLIAYLTKFMPQGMRFANAASIQVHVELEEAARIHGASWWDTVRSVTFPLMGPGLLVGWLYVMVYAFREVSASVLLYTTGTEVIAVNAFSLWQNGEIGPATAIGVLIVVVLGVVVGSIRYLASRAGVAAD